MLITGTSGNDTKNGTASPDTFDMTQGGNDTVNGEGGADIFKFGAKLNAADKINGGAGDDTLNISGAYNIAFNSTTIKSVETINLAPGHNYSITTVNGNVASGDTLTVDGSGLGSGNSFKFNGSAETDGKFVIHGGAGNDHLTGGSKADVFFDDKGGIDHLFGEDGDDIFNMGSTLTTADRILGSYGDDTVNIAGNYTGGHALILGAQTLSGIHTLHLGAGHSYAITTSDESFVTGDTGSFHLIVDGSSLGAGNTMTIDATAQNNTGLDLRGGAGADTFEFSGNFDPQTGFKVNGGAGNDTISLDGTYSFLNFGLSQDLRNVENMILGAGHNYDISVPDVSVAAGKTLTLDATALGSANEATFDGSAETDGHFVLHGGAGDDFLTGGDRSDTFFEHEGGNDTVGGGGGSDIINMGAALTSGDNINGGNGNDTVNVTGDYTGANALSINASSFRSIETLHLGAGHNYKISATGDFSGTLTVDGSDLAATNSLNLTASALGGSLLDVLGSAGDDTFNYRNTLNGSMAIDGGDGSDTLILNGDYSSVLLMTAGHFLNLETILLSAGHSYDVNFSAGNLTASQTLTVDGSALGSGDFVNFFAASGSDGHYHMTGGAGDDRLEGSSQADILNGGAGDDSLNPGGGGDTVNGNAGSDFISYDTAVSGRLASSDHINGGSGADVVNLTGDYSAGLTLTGSMLTSVEDIFVYGSYGYNFTLDSSLLSTGSKLHIDAADPTDPSETLTVDGSAVSGNLAILAGASHDVLTGGSGNDYFEGGGGSDTLNGRLGADIYYYAQATDSTGPNYDQISGFNATADKFMLNFTVGDVDPKVTGGALSTGSFNSDLAAAIGGSELAANHAVLFAPNSGTLAGDTFLIIDVNGNPGYQAHKDLVIELINGSHFGAFGADDFIPYAPP